MVIPAEDFPEKLRSALAPIPSITTSEHQGMTSTVVFAETALGSVAIKRAVGLRFAMLQREKMVLDALKGSGLPVPECLLYIEEETGTGKEGWLVITRLPGEPLLKVLREVDNPSRREDLHNKLGKVIARLHAMPAPPQFAPISTSWLDDMLALAESNLAVGIGDGTREELAWLKQNIPTPVPAACIHGDLFFDNVLSDGTEITGLIDWSFGALGDPRYDMATAQYGLTAGERRAFLDGYGRTENISLEDELFFMILADFY
jgi:aminoglycoside phosphotransferase (APT) family kinase protein